MKTNIDSNEFKDLEVVRKDLEKLNGIFLNEGNTEENYNWKNLFNKSKCRPLTSTGNIKSRISAKSTKTLDNTLKSSNDKKDKPFKFPIALIDEEYGKIKDFIEIPKYQDPRRQMAETYSNFHSSKNKTSRCKSANRVVDTRPER